jgi:hypothetical protein
MQGRKLLLVLLAGIAAMQLSGCGGDAARSAQPARAKATPASAVANMESHDLQAPRRAEHSSHRDAQREGLQSTYHNPEAGISFRYPRNYSLKEGDVEEHSFFLKRQEDLDVEQPGATLLATILVPEDGFPNTTFEHGSVQLIVNETGSEKACREATWAAHAGTDTGNTTVQGIPFGWKEEQSEMAGTKVLERTYAGYSTGTCYEFVLTVAEDDTADPHGAQRPADIGKIMKHLEKIVGSTQIFTKSSPPPAEDSEEAAQRLQS